jgi:hypothetical protein
LGGSSLKDIVDRPTGGADGCDFKDLNTVVNRTHTA